MRTREGDQNCFYPRELRSGDDVERNSTVGKKEIWSGGCFEMLFL